MTSYEVRGTVQEVNLDQQTLVIQHQEIPGYMKAMTMPFRVRNTNLLSGIEPGHEINFLLKVTPSNGWIERITITGARIDEMRVLHRSFTALNTNSAVKLNLVDALSAYKFTNEFGQPVHLNTYKGQAIGLTFFFTSCPFPEFCPRLMRDFSEASHAIQKDSNSPTNWHLFALTIDPEVDTPGVLHKCGKTYGYDPEHWSFLSTDLEALGEITKNFGFQLKREGKVINHSFYTAVINPEGDLRNFWRVGGNTSSDLAHEILEACQKTKPH